MLDYLALMVLLLLGFAATVGQRFGHLSPVGLFGYIQSVMAIGVLRLLDPLIPADVVHANLLIGTFVALWATSFFFAVLLPAHDRRDRCLCIQYEYPVRAVWLLILLSLGVCVAYYTAVGYVGFLRAVSALMNGTEEDIAGLRLSSYAGERYLFPGYVNQFKNALLPSLSIVVIVTAYWHKSRGRHVIFVLLTTLNLVFLIGTGQRLPVMRTALFVLVLMYVAFPQRLRRSLPALVLAVCGLFVVTTFATGRAGTELEAAESMPEVLGVFLNQAAFRLFGSSQLAARIGFAWVSEQDIPFGSEWWGALLGMLPGRTGPDTANQVHALLYGSTRGTAPLSLWGSAYYNFGYFGAILFAVLLSYLLTRISASILRLKRLNLIEASGIAGVTTALGLWMTDGMTTPLNGGLVVYAFLWLWGCKIRGSSHLSPDPPAVAACRPARPAHRPRQTTRPGRPGRGGRVQGGPRVARFAAAGLRPACGRVDDRCQDGG